MRARTKSFEFSSVTPPTPVKARMTAGGQETAKIDGRIDSG